MALTKYMDIEVEILEKVNTNDLTRVEKELLLLILQHFAGVYAGVYFTRAYSFLDGFFIF